MIILNGGITVDGTEIYFDDLIIESGEDLDMPFDFLIDDEEDYCDEDCDDCECCEFDEDEKQEDFNAEFEFLLNLYTEILSESCVCKDCIREILLEFLDDFWDILGE